MYINTRRVHRRGWARRARVYSLHPQLHKPNIFLLATKRAGVLSNAVLVLSLLAGLWVFGHASASSAYPASDVLCRVHVNGTTEFVSFVSDNKTYGIVQGKAVNSV